MRIAPKRQMIVLVPIAGMLAVLALVAAPVAGALAGTGGTPGGGGSTTPGQARPHIHTTGIATWFGPGFYGQKTACGQTLTPEVVGVANRTLPCGTLVKVSYKGHSLTVPVLDRGPYSRVGADWDLTAGAATALDITETVRVGTRVVGAMPNTPTLGMPLLSATATLAGGAIAG
jgi:rare lipoprotein A (peptidoglycan hydrolase)